MSHELLPLHVLHLFLMLQSKDFLTHRTKNQILCLTEKVIHQITHLILLVFTVIVHNYRTTIFIWQQLTQGNKIEKVKH